MQWWVAIREKVGGYSCAVVSGHQRCSGMVHVPTLVVGSKYFKIIVCHAFK